MILNLPSWSEYCLIISNWKLLLNSIQTPALILTEHYFFNGIFIDGKKMAHKKNENEFYDF